MPVPQPVHRLIFRADSRGGANARPGLADTVRSLGARSGSGIVTLALFAKARDLFLYAESRDRDWNPEAHFASEALELSSWPGAETPRRWVPMMDIFHYQRCDSADRWVRRRPPESRRGTVVRLRPEMVSSYIHYHFQLQEEAARGRELFGTIGIHENLLFFYVEAPNFVEPPYYRRLLSTHLTPADWSAAMAPHFQPWSDAGEAIWRPCELVAAV